MNTMYITKNTMQYKNAKKSTFLVRQADFRCSKNLIWKVIIRLFRQNIRRNSNYVPRDIVSLKVLLENCKF